MPKNIGMMGTSRGGSTGLLAVDDKMRARFAQNADVFKAVVAVYPGCTSHFQVKTASRTKLLVQLAKNDEVAPPAQCRQVLSEMKDGGLDVVVTEYEAPHAWDSAVNGRRVRIPDEQSFGTCNFVIDASGIRTERTTGIRITSPRLAAGAIAGCSKDGAYAGSDRQVAARSLAELIAFFRHHLMPRS